MAPALQVPEQRSISVVTPVYNGEASMGELCRRLAEVLPHVATEYEIILVNDGSRDQSWKIISELSSPFATVRGLNLMRNYGQHNALLCEIRAAKYEILVTMDDDLQHPPEEIPRLLEQLEQGFDVVYGSTEAERNGLMSALASSNTRLALRATVGTEVAKQVSTFGISYAIARSVRRLSDFVCFHRRATHLGNNEPWCDKSCLFIINPQHCKIVERQCAKEQLVVHQKTTYLLDLSLKLLSQAMHCSCVLPVSRLRSTTLKDTGFE